MEELEPSPTQVILETWRESPLELLVPATVGAAAAHTAAALFALNSYYSLLLVLCLGAAAFAAVRTCVFLYRLLADRKADRETVLSQRDVAELFLPIIASIALYGIIAPNYLLGIFFLLASLPHAGAVVYLAKYHARVSAEKIEWSFEWKPLVGRAAFMWARTFRKTPDFTAR